MPVQVTHYYLHFTSVLSDGDDVIEDEMGSAFRKRRLPTTHTDVIFQKAHRAQCIWSYRYIANHQQLAQKHSHSLFLLKYHLECRCSHIISARWDERDSTFLKSKLFHLVNSINTFRILLIKDNENILLYVMLYFHLSWCFQLEPLFSQLFNASLESVNFPFIWIPFFLKLSQVSEGMF